jgi:Spy/CpxP family protein refolding chaperone
MADGMKSALELALERTDHVRKAIHEEGLSLTNEQRMQLADLEREYSAKIAEKDVMLQTELRKLVQFPPAEAVPVIEHLRERFIEEKRKLVVEKEEKAARIRQAHQVEGSTS